MFLDSGGFKLLHNTELSLSKFGIHKETETDDILDFQLGLGGDIIASLDYPLPPGLVRSEAEVTFRIFPTHPPRRTHRSIIQSIG